MFVTLELLGCLKFGDSLIRSYRRSAVVSASPHRGNFNHHTLRGATQDHELHLLLTFMFTNANFSSISASLTAHSLHSYTW